jgi:alpha-1,2-mannosyltransferase
MLAASQGSMRWSAGWAGVVLAGALAHLLLWSFSEPAILFNDYYKAYYPVAEYLWFDSAEPWPALEAGAGGFVNLPIVGWLFAPFAAVDEVASGWVYLAVGAAGTLAAWWLLTRSFAPASGGLLLLLFLLNGPMVNSLREGNSTHLVLLLLVCALLLWRTGRGFAAGALFAASGIIKLPLLLLGLYFLVRARWTIVAGMVAMGIGTGLLSLLVHGWTVNAGWYRDSVAPYLGGVIPAFNVQSIDGFLGRLWTGTEHLMSWLPLQPTLPHKITRYASIIFLLGGTWWLMRRTARASPSGELWQRDYIEFCLVLTIALVISPICWSHYYLLMLLPAALHLGGLTLSAAEPRWRTAFWIGYALTALPIVQIPLPAGWLGEVTARSMLSLWLFGGLLVLAAHARALWRIGRQ